MIPNVGGSDVGPVLALVAVIVGYGVVCRALWATALIDRPQLSARRAASIGAVVGVLLLSAAALWLSYGGSGGHRCPAALATYGFRTDALAHGSATDDCAFAGEMLVTLGWATPLLTSMIGGIAWWAGKDDN